MAKESGGRGERELPSSPSGSVQLAIAKVSNNVNVSRKMNLNDLPPPYLYMLDIHIVTKCDLYLINYVNRIAYKNTKTNLVCKTIHKNLTF